MTTRGWRPSCEQRLARVVEVRVRVPAGAHLLDRKVEDLGREPRPKRLRHARARGRLRAPPPRPPAARPTARPSRTGAAARGPASTAPARRRVGMARHPAEDLRRRSKRAELRGGARAAARTLRRETGEHVADRRRRDERPDQMAAAALVLLRRALAVLVRADRDVLGAVIRASSEPRIAKHRRRERQQPGEQLLRRRPQPLRLADALHDDRRAGHRREHARALHRQLRAPGSFALHLRQERERLDEPGRAAQHRARHARRAETLQRGRDLEPPSRMADRARPRVRAVHEHAVRERHPAEPDLLVAHRSRG